MATRFYFHAALYNTTRYPGSYPDTDGESQIVITNPQPTKGQTGADATSVHRSMDTNIGNSETSFAITRSATSGTTQSSWVAKFISPPLRGVSSISANTWVTQGAHQEGSLNSNFGGLMLSLYVWRPSTNALVGGQLIYDGNGAGGFGEPASINTERLAKGNHTAGAGRSISGVQDGDVIIAEVFFRKTTGSSATFTDTWFYDGGTDYPSGSNGDIVTDIASYIETPQNLTFMRDLNQTITHSLTLASTHTRLKTILARTITHSLVITSGHTRLRGLIQLFTESLVITSTHTRLRGRWRTITHSLVIASAHSRIVNRLRTMTHSLTLTSSHTRLKTILPRTITHALTLVSDHTRLRGLVQTVSHNLTLLESSMQTLEGVKVITHTLTFVSDHTRLKGLNRSATHSLAFVSDHTRLRGLIQTITHALTIVSDHTRLRGLNQTASHTITFTSDHVEIKGKWRAISHDLTLTSGHTRLTTRMRTIIHSLTFTSGHTRIRGLIQTISHALAFTSDHVRLRGLIQTISHSLAFTSNHARIRLLVQTVSHSLSFVSSHIVGATRYFYIRRLRIRSNKGNV